RELPQHTPGADLTLPCDVDGRAEVGYVGVWSHEDDAASDAPYRLRISFEGDPPLPNPSDYPVKARFAIVDVETEEIEPNDTALKANPIKLGSLVAGQIGKKGDIDFFKVDLPKGSAGRLIVTLQQLDSSPVQPMVAFYNSERAEVERLWFNLPGGDLTASTELTGRHESYYVAISDNSGDASTNVPYVFRVDLTK